MLILVPAGFLVLLLLGGIAVDSAVAYLGQRQVGDAAAGAANDAATAALDDARFYTAGTLQLDGSKAADVVCRAIRADGNGALHNLTVAIAIDGPVITVRAHAEVEAVFGRLVPGYGHQQVSAESSASATRGASPDLRTPSNFTPISCPVP